MQFSLVQAPHLFALPYRGGILVPQDENLGVPRPLPNPGITESTSST